MKAFIAGGAADQTVKFTKWPSGWSAPVIKKVSIWEAMEWLANHQYTLVRARDFEGERIMKFQKPGCKTEYEIVANLEI